MRWDKMRWDEMRWDEMRWDEMRWMEIPYRGYRTGRSSTAACTDRNKCRWCRRRLPFELWFCRNMSGWCWFHTASASAFDRTARREPETPFQDRFPLPFPRTTPSRERARTHGCRTLATSFRLYRNSGFPEARNLRDKRWRPDHESCMSDLPAVETSSNDRTATRTHDRTVSLQ